MVRTEIKQPDIFTTPQNSRFMHVIFNPIVF